MLFNRPRPRPSRRRTGQRSGVATDGWPRSGAAMEPDGARHDAEGGGLQSETVRRHAGFQPARRCALPRRRPPSARAAVPLHHPLGAGQRAGALQRRRASRAQAEDALARWHHALRDVAAGVHALAGCDCSSPTPTCRRVDCGTPDRATASRRRIRVNGCRLRVGPCLPPNRTRRPEPVIGIDGPAR